MLVGKLLMVSVPSKILTAAKCTIAQIEVLIKICPSIFTTFGQTLPQKVDKKMSFETVYCLNSFNIWLQIPHDLPNLSFKTLGDFPESFSNFSILQLRGNTA